MAAGLQLKNYLTSKDPEVRLKYQQEWLKFEEAVRQHIKMLVSANLLNLTSFYIAMNGTGIGHSWH